MTRPTTSLFALFALLGLTAAQGPSSLPQCALNCATTASTAAGCTLTDIPCLCSHPSFISATLQCSHAACSLEDQSSASGVLEEMCATIPPSNSTSTTSSILSTRPAPTHTASPTAPSPRPQTSAPAPVPTPTPIASPVPVTTTVHDGTTTVTSASGGSTSLTPLPSTGTGNVTTVVMSTMTPPLPSGNAVAAAAGVVRAGWWGGVGIVLGLVVL